MAKIKNRLNRVLLMGFVAATLAGICASLAASKSASPESKPEPKFDAAKNAALHADRRSLEALIPGNPDELVYVTKNGKKYHKQQCHFAHAAGTTAIPLSKAVENYSPCTICCPPVFVKPAAKISLPEVKAEPAPVVEQPPVVLPPVVLPPLVLPPVVQERKALPQLVVQEAADPPAAPSAPPQVEKPAPKPPVKAQVKSQPAPTVCPNGDCPNNQNQPRRLFQLFRR